MKKSIFYYLIIFLILSCTKNTIETTEINTKSKNNSFVSSTQYTNIQRIQGLYLDSTFLIILGNSVKEDSLINWANSNAINKFSYYQMANILSSITKKTQLSAFITKAKNQGIPKHTATLASENTLNLIKSYNNAQPLTAKFTSIQIEDEWWQSSKNVSNYYDALELLKKMKSWAISQNPSVSVELYFGRFNNIPASNTDASDTLVKYSDEILISHEIQDTIINFYPVYLQDRINEFYNASLRASKPYPQTIIFYPSQAPIFYTNNSFKTAFSNISGRLWDDFVRSDDKVYGYQLFALKESRLIRPLPHLISFKVNNAPSKPLSGQVRVYDSTNTLIDSQTFSANLNTLKNLKQLPMWRMEVDVTNLGTTRYVMEVYIKGNFVKAYTINAGATRNGLLIPSPSQLHNLQGNVTLTFYPG
jgi:hypothetical protein